LTREQDSWTHEQKRLQALDAMGYSDDLGVTNSQGVDEFHDRLATDETRTSAGQSLLDKAKTGAK
jgi:hypothetical protein